MRVLALVVLLGGCSAFLTRDRTNERGEKVSCGAPLFAPVFDSVAAGALVLAGTALLVTRGDDGDLELVPHREVAVISFSAAVPYALSAAYGYRSVDKCTVQPEPTDDNDATSYRDRPRAHAAARPGA